jgi:tellurite resistance protein TerC
MLIWIAFIVLIFIFLALDLGVFNKKPHQISTKEALTWTTLWVSISLAFSGVIYLLYSNDMVANTTQLTTIQAVIKYLTGYLIELSLSLDNIFVIAVIFGYFKVPRIYQHRVLFWGILGAVVFRAIFIFIGVVLIESISWMTYVFGALLLYSAYKMFNSEGEEVDPRSNPIVKMVKRFYPVTRDFEGDKFWVKKRKITAVTPLFIALVVVETTDILFAIDSIPAILAITTDPFLVFTSNIFAILGLRSLYFVLAAMLDRFKLLKYSLVLILAFVGVKLILAHHVPFPEWLSLAVIVLSLAGGIIASLLVYEKTEEKEKIKEESL